MKQKTVRKKVSFSGKALQTGAEVKVDCKPASPGEGIIFRRTDLAEAPVLRVSGAAFSGSYQRRSTLGDGAAEVQTVEHFMAALWGLEIDNMIVDISGAELPALDGSAAEFIRLLKSAGLEEQPALREYIKITEKEEIKESDSSLSVFPDESFRVSYLIDYKISSIGREVFDMDPGRDSFEKEIAPARTFCLKSEAEALLRAGLGKGATYENTLVLDDDGPVGTTLRFPNEPVRHKVLDLIGDFYMLGKPIIGRVAAERSGHSLNAKMVRRIYEKYVANKKKSFE
jgi:UDP-3-O-acyl N-acetylglucosamine deacetylase